MNIGEIWPSLGDKVLLGDDGGCQVLGSETVKIMKFVNKCYPSVIEDVLYVPKLKKNLFSVGVATKKGFEAIFSGNEIKFVKDGRVQGSRFKTSKLHLSNVFHNRERVRQDWGKYFVDEFESMARTFGPCKQCDTS